jgi:hypothetical protein
MRNIVCTVLALIYTLSGAQTLESSSFSLKGYFVGMILESCPGASFPAKGHMTGATNCLIAADTLGGVSVSSVFVTIWRGQVVSVGAVLEERGRNAGGPLVAALSEKYGRPDSTRAHLNEYVWHNGNQRMRFDGYGGSLLASDTAALAELRRINALANKKDL